MNQLKSLLIKNRLSILASLFLSTIVTPTIVDKNKALAGSPSAYNGNINLSVDLNQCMEKASKAASLVLPSLNEPIVREEMIVRFGNTKDTSTTIMCVKKSQGSTLVFVSSGDSWNDSVAKEAKSIRDRIIKVLSDSL